MSPIPYRLGFAVKVLGAPEPLKEADSRGLAERPEPGPLHRSAGRVQPSRTDRRPGADLVTPWDFLELIGMARGPIDVMLEAKAKDVALLTLRRQLRTLAPEVADAED